MKGTLTVTMGKIANPTGHMLGTSSGFIVSVFVAFVKVVACFFPFSCGKATCCK